MHQYIWNFSAYLIGNVLPPVLTFYLARILEPSDFGRFAIYLAALSLVQALVFSAMGEIILKSTNQKILDQIFSLQLVLIIILCPVFMLLSIVNPWGIGDWKTIFAMGVLLCLIAYVDSSIKYSMKEKQFQKVFHRKLISPLGNAFVSIPLALKGLGFWSLILGQISSYLFVAIYIRLSRNYPRLNFNWGSLKNELDFGINMYAQNTVKWIRSKADRMALGFYRSASETGTYDLTRLLSSLPFTSIVEPIAQVLYSRTLELKSRQEVRDYYHNAQRRILLVSTSLFLFLEINSEILIKYLLGEKYLGVVVLFRIFLVEGLLSTLVGTNMEFFKTISRPSLMTRFMIVRAMLTIAVLLISTPRGLDNLAVAMMILSLLFVPINILITQKTMEVSYKIYYDNVISLPFKIMIFQGVIGLVFSWFLSDALLILIASFVVMAASVIWSYIVFEKSLLNEVFVLGKE